MNVCPCDDRFKFKSFWEEKFPFGPSLVDLPAFKLRRLFRELLFVRAPVALPAAKVFLLVFLFRFAAFCLLSSIVVLLPLPVVNSSQISCAFRMNSP